MRGILHGTYTGTEEKLAGKTALLRAATVPYLWLAQFDDMALEESHGWHPFSKKFFELDVEKSAVE